VIIQETDMNTVARIFNHPKVCDWITDDGSPVPVVPDPSYLYIVNEERTGLAAISPLTSSTGIIHFAALPELWGKTLDVAREAIAWVFNHTQYVKIIGFTPECNRMALVFGKRCGFKEEGIIEKSFMKNWTLYDMIVVGLSKYDFKEA
jgi:RimJ/RimL family protein N-acetyltransferase